MTKKLNKKVAVGLSGGVDSSVAAYLLEEQGYDVTGVYLQCWDVKMDGCVSDEDRAYAVQVAAQMGIKFEKLDFKKQYKAKVIEYFYNEYASGRTPNPDVMCNKEIKFGLFYDWAMQKGFDFVATGHYARIEEIANGRQSLLKGKDPSKDQSYFLYLLNRGQLSKVLFPVGDLKKNAVREIAKKAKLITYKRPESMGICFVGEVDIRKFLEQRIVPTKGRVVATDGSVTGEHDGVWFYTIGQRHGFRLSKYSGTPMYVVSKNVEKNELVVGSEKEACRRDFLVGALHWINETLGDTFSCEVRIRHLGKLYKANVTKTITGESAAREVAKPGEYRVVLAKPVFGVAPGQSAVFYKGDEVLGGGVIQ